MNKKQYNFNDFVFDFSYAMYDSGVVIIPIFVSIVCFLAWTFRKDVLEIIGHNDIDTALGIIGWSCAVIAILPFILDIIYYSCIDDNTLYAFIRNESTYNKYIFFPHDLSNGRLLYNYDCLTDYTYCNIKDEIVPALQNLYTKARYNKATKIKYKTFKPQISELYNTMKKFLKSVSKEKDELVQIKIMDNFNDSVDDILVYINNLTKQLDEIIEDEKQDIEDKEIAHKQLVQNINVENFGTIKMMNELSRSDIDELSEKYDNSDYTHVLNEIEQLNKELEDKPKSKKKIRKKIKKLEKQLETLQV